jgi:hypothetical protein
MTAMEIAKIVLEYVSVLVWPVTVLVLVLRFRRAISEILSAVGNRLASAETVKVGVLGQEFELSGTARELKLEQEQLLVASKADHGARERAGRVAEAIPELNSPIADMAGVSLLNVTAPGLLHDELLDRIVAQFGSDAVKGPQAALVLSSLSRTLEKILFQFVQLGLMAKHHNRYVLSTKGREFFEKVAARHKHLLERFHVDASPPVGA